MECNEKTVQPVQAMGKIGPHTGIRHAKNACLSGCLKGWHAKNACFGMQKTHAGSKEHCLKNRCFTDAWYRRRGSRRSWSRGEKIRNSKWQIAFCKSEEKLNLAIYDPHLSRRRSISNRTEAPISTDEKSGWSGFIR